MKRMILATATMFVLTAGAALAQNPLNTTAPGPTQQRAPGQTNNDLPNPGNPLPAPQGTAAPVTENGTVSGTATESMQHEQTTTTGTTDMDHSNMDMDHSATGGTVDTTTTTTTTDTSVGTTPAPVTDTTTTTSGSLPATGSELPLVGLIGLSALAGAVALRASRS